MKLKFLLDENISPKTTLFLRSLGLEVSDVGESGLRGKDDDKIYNYAKENKFILVTYDHEFGYFYISRKDLLGLIILRINPQTLEKVHKILERFFELLRGRKIELTGKLIIIENSRFRVRKVNQ